MKSNGKPASATRRGGSGYREAVGQIRWDRMGRFVLIMVLLGVMGLYIGPTRSYLSTRNEFQTKQIELKRLEREYASLNSRERQLRNPKAIEEEARKLGMVRPDERPYVVQGLQKTP